MVMFITRATADISDPYIQQLQKLSTTRPPQLPKFDTHPSHSAHTRQKKKTHPTPQQSAKQKPRVSLSCFEITVQIFEMILKFIISQKFHLSSSIFLVKNAVK